MLNICGKIGLKAIGLVVLLLIPAVLGGCKEEGKDPRPENSACMERFHGRSLEIVSDCGGERVVRIRSIVGRDTLEKFFVLRDSASYAAGKPLPGFLEGAKVLRYPLQRVAVLSSAQIGYMLRLGLGDRIVAVGAGKYVADSSLYEKVAAGQIAEVSPDGMNVDYEKLMALKPDLVMTFATGGSQDDYDRMEKLGIPVMLTSEWQENSLDAKAEWLWLYDALFGGNGELERIYGLDTPMDLSRYRELEKGAAAPDPCKKDVSDNGPAPRVLAGMSYGGVWYAPGGRSYTADLIRRAGGCYLWAADSSRELKLTIEDVMALADSADLWINPGMLGSPDEILAAEPRAAHIRAFREKKVFQNDGRKGLGGGNDFFEGAVARPEDLVKNLGYLFSEFFMAKTPDSVKPAFEWYHNIF